ncbi:hypothetical protein E2C01_100731 [Portunus trituberculatus]|uniref:Uncharacterized protein n=1 Tax=Portunus trituberculatus TaxID=210409 RepID=A0A5B7K8U0_PORTR|nr:hypothetical protein [Portunus trituberculatus]
MAERGDKDETAEMEMGEEREKEAEKEKKEEEEEDGRKMALLTCTATQLRLVVGGEACRVCFLPSLTPASMVMRKTRAGC